MSRGLLTIGLDIATANVRCVVLDIDSADPVIAEASSPLPQPSSDGAGEVIQEPRYKESTREALQEALAALSFDQRSRVAAICVSGTSGTVLAVDAHGQAMSPALMYSDSRGAHLLGPKLQADVEARPTATLGRLAWLSQQFDGVRLVASSDYVVEWLLGCPLRESDTSHWLKAGINPAEGSWPADTLAELGISASSLPNLVSPGTELGLISLELAREFGLGRVAIVAGMTDGCTSQIATGAMGAGDSVGVLGTTLVLKAVSKQSVSVPALGVYSHVSPDGTFLPGGASNTGAGVLAKVFGYASPATLEQRGRAAIASGPAGYLDYVLPGVGERFPVSSANITSFRVGEPTGSTDNYRAVLEGVAFSERLGLEILSDQGVVLKRHVISGGGSSSPSWSKIRATVLGRPIFRARHGDSAVGASFLAAHFLVGGLLADFLAWAAPISHQIDPLTTELDMMNERYREFLAALVSKGFLQGVPNSLT